MSAVDEVVPPGGAVAAAGPPGATAAVGASPGRAVTVGIVAAYIVVFFGLLPALLWTLGGRLDILLALPDLGVRWTVAGLALTAVGAAWMIWSMTLLRVVGGGWPISHLPPTRLVTSGPYRVNKHPIYVGYVTLFAGLALAAGSLGRLLAAGVLVLGVVDYVLGVEGPGLRRRFSGGYQEYRPGSAGVGRTPRLLWAVLRPPLQRLANWPVLFRVGPTVWVSYGLFVALGCAISTSLLFDRLATDGLSAGDLAWYAAIVAPAMAVGGRLLWFVVEWAQVRAMGWRRAMRTVGLVSWGTYVGFFAGSGLFAVLFDRNVLWLLDRTVPPVLLCSVIGRIGCLTYGCCFGRHWADGIVWHAPESKIVRQFGAEAATAGRVPVQLLSAISTLTAILVADLVSLRPAPAGAVTGIVMLLYGLGRFGVDSFRDNAFGLPWARGLNLGHVVSLLVIVVALAILFTAHGAPSWPHSAWHYQWGLLTPLLPVIAVATVAVFVVSGLHWRRVGQW